jgi:hypothetical protein
LIEGGYKMGGFLNPFQRRIGEQKVVNSFKRERKKYGSREKALSNYSKSEREAIKSILKRNGED